MSEDKHGVPGCSGQRVEDCLYKPAMRRLALFFATLAAVSCNKDTELTNAPGTAAPAAVVTPETAAPTEAAPTPEEEAATKKKAEDEAAAKKMEAHLAARLKQAEENAGEAKARWTPDVVAAFVKARDKKYGSDKARLKAVLNGDWRAPGNADRDKFRHPEKTLAFFGLKSDMSVFEIGQGAGWYTEVLAPFLAKKGKFFLAGYDANSEDPQAQFGAKSMEHFINGPAPLYANVETVTQGPSGSPMNLGPEGSLDMVVVIRMFHNVERFDLWDRYMPPAHAALKDGAVLAVVQHRAVEGADPKQSAQKGYLPQQWLIEKIEGYGFKLDKKSEINANPKDTKDYAKGVWTLPPSLAAGDTDKAKYEAIGESDRMTLRFVKVKK